MVQFDPKAKERDFMENLKRGKGPTRDEVLGQLKAGTARREAEERAPTPAAAFDGQGSGPLPPLDEQVSILRAWVGALEQKVETKMALLGIADGVARKKDEEIERLKDRIAELEAPPIVPAGCRVVRTTGCPPHWAVSAIGDLASSPGALRGLAYAIETGLMPPHADDKKEGEG